MFVCAFVAAFERGGNVHDCSSARIPEVSADMVATMVVSDLLRVKAGRETSSESSTAWINVCLTSSFQEQVESELSASSEVLDAELKADRPETDRSQPPEAVDAVNGDSSNFGTKLD